jgi:hypothetical protein
MRKTTSLMEREEIYLFDPKSHMRKMTSLTERKSLHLFAPRAT